MGPYNVKVGAIRCECNHQTALQAMVCGERNAPDHFTVVDGEGDVIGHGGPVRTLYNRNWVWGLPGKTP